MLAAISVTFKIIVIPVIIAVLSTIIHVTTHSFIVVVILSTITIVVITILIIVVIIISKKSHRMLDVLAFAGRPEGERVQGRGVPKVAWGTLGGALENKGCILKRRTSVYGNLSAGHRATGCNDTPREPKLPKALYYYFVVSVQVLIYNASIDVIKLPTQNHSLEFLYHRDPKCLSLWTLLVHPMFPNELAQRSLGTLIGPSST